MRIDGIIKQGVDPMELTQLKPSVKKILMFYFEYCLLNELDCKITSIRADRLNVKSVSKTHQEFRAVDVGVRQWPIFHIHNFVNLANQKFKDIGAISKKTGESVAVLYHDNHLHLQSRPE